MMTAIERRAAADPAGMAAALDPVNRYYNVRVLKDGTIIAVHKLMFTYSLIVDIGSWSWGDRYCYNTEAEAIAACNAMEDGGDTPLPGYIAKRTTQT